VLNFFDTDVGWLDSEDDYMGRAVIFLKDVGDSEKQDEKGNFIGVAKDDRVPTPRWYPVKFALDDPWDAETGAAVLVSFAALTFDEEFALDADEMDLAEKLYLPPESAVDIPRPLPMPDLGIEEYNVIINVLGLRGLLSAGLLPVKKAYVKFSVKSLLPPAQAKAVADIYTVPNEGGQDPNIRTTLKFSVNISSEPHYCPQMTCTTYDKLYFDGMRQPILGTFSLKLGDILTQTRQADADSLADVTKFEDVLAKAIAKKKGPDANKTILEIVNELWNAQGSNMLRIATLRQEADRLREQEHHAVGDCSSHSRISERE